LGNWPRQPSFNDFAAQEIKLKISLQTTRFVDRVGRLDE
jgi:hypothetical protein